MVDDELKLLPDGEIGQLLVTGDGLADGYLNLPEQTAERFRADPRPGATGRCYMTGDLVRRRPDGVLEFFGRIDRR
ncbi:MAG: AMP-binding protein [Paracoccaceae bacterium]